MFVIANRIFDPAFECMARGDRGQFQATHLRRLVEQAQKIPFYRRRFAAKNILPESLHSIDDIRRLPFTTDRDLREGYPFGFIAAPRPDLARLHVSGGDRPIFTAFTRQDMKLRAALCARLLVGGGLSADQLVQEVFGCGLPTDGFGLYGGIERVG
ncbi:MAG: hypothetical protein PHI35_01475, partial [Victivallaceae bacterium]|nr:hypothetical protein [Victivallaceae bacterium]